MRKPLREGKRKIPLVKGINTRDQRIPPKRVSDLSDTVVSPLTHRTTNLIKTVRKPELKSTVPPCSLDCVSKPSVRVFSSYTTFTSLLRQIPF